MKIFISWSGERSRQIAEALHRWIPRVLQSAKPWMSGQDISAGARWSNELSSELSEAKAGIICVTADNQSNPWLAFEAGALSKTLEQTFVCPILLDVNSSQISGPLSQFQSISADRPGVFKLVETLNQKLDNQIDSETLSESVDLWWPKLENILKHIPKPTKPSPHRTHEEILEEIVLNTREQLRRENVRLEIAKEKESRIDQISDFFLTLFHAQANPQSTPILSENLKKSLRVPDSIANKINSGHPQAYEALMAHILHELKTSSEKQNALNSSISSTPENQISKT